MKINIETGGKEVSVFLEADDYMDELKIKNIQEKKHLSSDEFRVIKVKAKVFPEKTREDGGMTIIVSSAALQLII